jgi:hypothetical protein
MLNEIVTLAKQWPEAEVKTITLDASDASHKNKLRGKSPQAWTFPHL